jgi:predicted oxidoreductase
MKAVMSQLPIFSNDKGQTLTYPLAPGLQSTRFGLGCMHFGGTWEAEGDIPDEARQRAREALETALELGWDFYDHADIYCKGRSEVLFGELIREMKVPRESIIVQTKCGIRFPDDPKKGLPHRFDFSKAHIIASVENSLKRLGMDYIDILLLHRPDLLGDPQEVMEAFAELHGSGKVVFFGVSNFTPPLLDLYREAGFTPVANQVELNLLRTSLIDSSMVSEGRNPAAGHTADGTLEWHRMRGVVTQAWAPMAYGYLSGRAPDWDPERVAKAATKVREVAKAHGAEPEAIVIAWLLRHPAMIQPIIGTRDPARLRACDAALKVHLSREEWYSLYQAGRGRGLP